jgi:SHS family lactate transporter-like MFS transporter
MLFAFRGLFGIGMGGMWAAGMPLALEHWPSRLRGLGSGLLQGGYSLGFLLSSLVYQFGYPLVAGDSDWGWRLMLWAGVLPAMVVFAVMWTVPESPVWLEQQRRQVATGEKTRVSLVRLFDRDLRPVTLHTSLLMGAYVWMYHSTTFWYPTLLALLDRTPLAFLVAINAGAVIGSIVFGAISEHGIGRRGASTLGMAISLLGIPLFVWSTGYASLLAGAWIMGLFAAGAWGIVPGYLSERFPTDARGVGVGFSYHVGVGLGSFAPYLIGALQDRGMPLADAMLWCIAAGGLLVITLLWLGPETRGRSLDTA